MKTDFTEKLADIYENFTITDYYAKNYDIAIIYIDKAWNIRKTEKDLDKYYHLLIAKSDIYFDAGNKKTYPIDDSLYQYYKNNNNPNNLVKKTEILGYYINILPDTKELKKAKILIDTLATYRKKIEEKNDEGGNFISSYNYVLSKYELKNGKPILNKAFY